MLRRPASHDYRVSEADILYGIAWSLVDDGMTLLPHPVTGQPFASPVPPGTGWPDDPATPTTPVARTPAAVRRLAATDDLRELEARTSVCAACPRLVRWREDVARDKRASFATSPTGAGRSRAGARRPPGSVRRGS